MISINAPLRGPTSPEPCWSPPGTTLVMVRMRTDPRTRNYVERRINEGLSKKEIIRCLKRYVAREVYHRLEGVNEQ